MKLYTIMRSNIHGWGIFANQDIPARTKIGEADGPLVSLSQLKRILKQCPATNFWEFERSMGPKKEAKVLTNDLGMRMNHSCKPNAFVRQMHTRLEVYTKQPIMAGEEITVTYITDLESCLCPYHERKRTSTQINSLSTTAA